MREKERERLMRLLVSVGRCVPKEDLEASGATKSMPSPASQVDAVPPCSILSHAACKLPKLQAPLLLTQLRISTIGYWHGVLHHAVSQARAGP